MIIDLAKLEKICPECDGSGYIGDPEWNEYLKKEIEIIKKYETQGLKPDEYWPKVKTEMEKLGYFEPDGPEEYECPDCEGRGTVLTEEGMALIDFVKKYLD